MARRKIDPSIMPIGTRQLAEGQPLQFPPGLEGRVAELEATVGELAAAVTELSRDVRMVIHHHRKLRDDFDRSRDHPTSLD